MVSFDDIIKCKADEHKFENQIPEEYECVKIDTIIGKEFVIDIFNVYHDKETDRNKVALAIQCDGHKYRIHTGASRIVELFEAVNAHNEENPDDVIDVSGRTYKIQSINVSKGSMLILN